MRMQLSSGNRGLYITDTDHLMVLMVIFNIITIDSMLESYVYIILSVNEHAINTVLRIHTTT